MPKSQGSISDEVESRFDEIFQDEEDKTVIMDPGKITSLTSPIKELKSIVLSMDWEINDQTLERFGQEVERLLNDYQDEKKIVVLLKLLSSLGRYIKKKRHAAHPDSIKTLHSVYSSLEKVLLEKDAPDEVHKKLIAAEVKKFKELQGKVSPVSQTDGADGGSSDPPDMTLTHPIEPQYLESGTEQMEVQKASIEDYGKVQPTELEYDEPALINLDEMTPQQAAAYLLVEIKKTIKAEVGALRKEILTLLEME